MSLTEACTWTFLRCAIVALASLPLCRLLASQLIAARAWERKLTWAALLLPFLSPELIVGYAYRNYSLSLVHHPIGNEILYMCLIMLKFIPVGTAAIYFSPPSPISAEGLHCRRLLGSSTGISFWIRGPHRSLLPAFAAMFLLSFQDYELVSLLGATSWTIWLFESQVGGVPSAETFASALVPLLCQCIVLAPILLLLFASKDLPVAPESRDRTIPVRTRYAAWLFLLVGFIALCLIPFSIVFRSTLSGFAVLSQNRSLGRNLLNSSLFAVAAGMISYLLATFLLRLPASRRGGRTRRSIAVLCCVPGLLGSLLLALSVIHLFQTSVLSGIYDSPLPLLVGFVLFLMPRAVILLLLIQGAYSWESSYLSVILSKSPVVAQRMRGRELIWQLQFNGKFWIAMLLCYMVYFELTASYILHPMSMVPVSVRLYDFIHYGQIPGLSAMMAASFASLGLFVLLLSSLKRQLLSWFLP